jgi:hypothetical protein
MRLLFFFLFISGHFISAAQNTAPEFINKDSLLIVSKNSGKGFHHDYILFIPKGTPAGKNIFLLAEPNNTGKISDSIEVHKKAAVHLASVSSVGNNISTELKIPLLVPVFPRPASQPLLYTHALDRDIMTENKPELKRLDLQLLEMINDAGSILLSMNIKLEQKFLMSGFSASATFVNRFSFIHPGKIKALAIGGFNGKLLLPQRKINNVALNYPIGLNDFPELFSRSFAADAYRQLPQFIYMGRLDDNDAVQFDDAYSKKERQVINTHIGRKVQERYLACRQVYAANKFNTIFKTYEGIGHWTTAAIHLDIINFFLNQMKEK